MSKHHPPLNFSPSEIYFKAKVVQAVCQFRFSFQRHVMLTTTSDQDICLMCVREYEISVRLYPWCLKLPDSPVGHETQSYNEGLVFLPRLSSKFSDYSCLRMTVAYMEDGLNLLFVLPVLLNN